MDQKFFKNKFFITVGALSVAILFGLGFGIFLSVYLSHLVSVLMAIVVSVGWIFLSMSLFMLLRYYFANKILQETVSFLDATNKKNGDKLAELSRYIYGHHENIDENVPFYRKVAEQSYPLANVLGSFALTTKTNDTIILARWEHDENACFYHIGGSPIHEEQLVYILNQIQSQSLKDVSEEGIVWKKDDLEH